MDLFEEITWSANKYVSLETRRVKANVKKYSTMSSDIKATEMGLLELGMARTS